MSYPELKQRGFLKQASISVIMTMATKTISGIKSKAILSKYAMIAGECCVKKIKGSMKRAEFVFEKEEDAEFFEMMVRSSTILLDKVE